MTELVFKEIELAREMFLKNSHIEIHENPANGLVAAARSRMNGQTRSPHKAFCFIE